MLLQSEEELKIQSSGSRGRYPRPSATTATKGNEKADQWAEHQKPLEPEVTRPTGRVNDKLPEKENKKYKKLPSL